MKYYNIEEAPETMQIIILLPIVISLFPIPLAIPIAIIGTVYEQPDKWPLAVIWFIWCAIGLFFMWMSDKSKF